MAERSIIAAALAICLTVLGAGPLAGELSVESLHWELAQPVRGRKPVYADIVSLETAPPRIAGKLRARVVLKNRGPLAADGILLRYCLLARLAPVRSRQDGVWALPFLIEEKRVAKVGPNQLFEVSLDPSASMALPFNRYLRRVYASGFWPDQLKLQVMLSPHRGAVETIATQEIILPVTK